MTDPYSTRSQNLIFTLWGDFLKDRVDEVWVGSLITLLEPLGMTDQAVRSTLSRSLKNGWFDTRRQGRNSFYSLTPRAKRLLEEGSERLFAPRQPRPWDGRWHLLSYSVPENRRKLRDRLRQRLVWMGFGYLNTGTWITPYAVPKDLLDWLDASRAGAYVELFGATYEGADPHDLVRRAWDLAGLEAAMHAFLAKHGPRLEAALLAVDGGAGTGRSTGNGAERNGSARDGSARDGSARDGIAGVADATDALEPADAFAKRFELTQDYLDFPYVDPGLPVELLPEDWPGEAVRELFHRYHGLLSEPAESFVEAVLADAAALGDGEPAAAQEQNGAPELGAERREKEAVK